MLSREEYRLIRSYSKAEMERWLQLERNAIYNALRKEFNSNYKDELDSSIENFLFAIAYTLHFNEDISLDGDIMADFMSDLFVTVDLFRTGDYKPDDYRAALKEDGIEFKPYDYDRIYREAITPLQERNTKAKDELVKLILTEKPAEIEELKKVLEILNGGK